MMSEICGKIISAGEIIFTCAYTTVARVPNVLVYTLTLAGAEEILPAGPQQAAESRHAGRDLPLQQRTNSGADLQQVVWTDMPAELHLSKKQTHTVCNPTDMTKLHSEQGEMLKKGKKCVHALQNADASRRQTLNIFCCSAETLTMVARNRKAPFKR